MKDQAVNNNNKNLSDPMKPSHPDMAENRPNMADIVKGVNRGDGPKNSLRNNESVGKEVSKAQPSKPNLSACMEEKENRSSVAQVVDGTRPKTQVGKPKLTDAPPPTVNAWTLKRSEANSQSNAGKLILSRKVAEITKCGSQNDAGKPGETQAPHLNGHGGEERHSQAFGGARPKTQPTKQNMIDAPPPAQNVWTQRRSEAISPQQSDKSQSQQLKSADPKANQLGKNKK